MNWKILMVTLTSLAVFTACENKSGNDQSTEGKQLESEILHKKVETFHDEVMPEMKKLYDIEKALEKQIATVDESDSEKLLSLKQKSLQVKSAQDNMMNWMRSFHKIYNKDTTEAIRVKVLKEELLKIEKVNADMKSALKIGTN